MIQNMYLIWHTIVKVLANQQQCLLGETHASNLLYNGITILFTQAGRMSFVDAHVVFLLLVWLLIQT